MTAPNRPSGGSLQDMKSRNRKQERSPRYTWVFLLLVLFSTCLCAALIVQPQPAQGTGWLNVAMHSLLPADYRVDLPGKWVSPLGAGLIQDVLWDEDPASAYREYQQILSQLETPVASVTLEPGETAVQFSTRTPTPSSTASPTLVRSTATATATTTPTPTATLTPTSAYIPAATATQEKQPTRPKPTLLPTATATAAREPTEPAPKPTQPIPTQPPYPPPYP